MASLKQTLTSILLGIFILAAAFFALLPFLIKAEPAQKLIIAKVEELTNGEVTFDEFRLSYFPVIMLELRQFKLVLKDEEKINFKAETAKIYLQLISLLAGRPEISRVKIQGGEAVFKIGDAALLKEIKMDHIRLEGGPLRPKSAMKMTIEANLEGANKAISGKATATLDQFEEWNWHQAVLNGSFKLRDFNLSVLEKRLNSTFPFKAKNGQLAGRVDFRKQKGEEWLGLKGHMELKQFVYQMQEEANLFTSPELNAQFDIDLSWDAEKEDLILNRSTLVSPVGKIEVKGKGQLGTGEIREMRVTASGIVLESIPQYWIFLKEAIPFNIGFSGQSDLEMTVRGAADHLSFNGNWDLSPALLTYAGYFSKPKDFPLNVNFDCLLQEGKILGGDFSLRFKDTTAKATLTNLNLQTGDGQLNMITNKFSLSGWNELLPPFQQYQIQGETKLLLNVEGNAGKLQEAKTIVNLTLENGQITPPSGAQIRNAHVYLDYSPDAFSVKEARFEIADSPVIAEVVIYDPSNVSSAKAKITLPRFKPLMALTAFEELASEWLSTEAKAALNDARESVKEIFPEGESLENFFTEIQYEHNKWFIKNLELDAYGGHGELQGGIDFSSPYQSYWMDSEITRLSLAKFLGRGGYEGKTLDGNFFLKIKLMGDLLQPEDAEIKLDWPNRMSGEGTFSVTNGEFYTFDMLGAVGKIAELAGVNPYVSGTTRFDDVHSPVILRDGKIITDKLILVSPDVTVQAEGETSLEGRLNYRLDVYLSSPLTGQVLEPLLGQSAQWNKLFGPIPLLLAGPLSKPELKADPVQTPRLLEQLLAKKVQKVLRNFLPEELFFERRAST